MSNKKKAVAAGASAAQTVAAVKSNPYVQRVVEDDELRDNVRVAYASAQSAFNRLSGAKSPVSKTLVDDKKLHKDLQTAAEALRDVSGAFRQAPKKQRSGGLVGKLLVLVVGAGVAIGVSPALRNKVLDALFGAEEEFDYTSTTTPATPPPPPAPTPTPPAPAAAPPAPMPEAATSPMAAPDEVEIDDTATPADPPNSL